MSCLPAGSVSEQIIGFHYFCHYCVSFVSFFCHLGMSLFCHVLSSLLFLVPGICGRNWKCMSQIVPFLRFCHFLSFLLWYFLFFSNRNLRHATMMETWQKIDTQMTKNDKLINKWQTQTTNTLQKIPNSDTVNIYGFPGSALQGNS